MDSVTFFFKDVQVKNISISQNDHQHKEITFCKENLVRLTVEYITKISNTQVLYITNLSNTIDKNEYQTFRCNYLSNYWPNFMNLLFEC